MSAQPEIVICTDPEAMAAAAAHRIEAVVSEVADAGGRCSIALAGGGTPKAIYRLMAQFDTMPWDKIDFYFGDERCVAPDDGDSNYRMAWEALLGPRSIPEAQVFRMRGEDPDREAAAAAYGASLPESLSLVLLGMGGDGHTASLFPGHEAMGERERRVVPVKGPKPPPWRLTITAPVIEGAARVFVMAHGAGKAEKVARALEGDIDPASVPIQLARRSGGVWFLDEASAGGLGER